MSDDDLLRAIYAVMCDANRDCCAESGFGSGALADCEDQLIASSGAKYAAAYEAGTVVPNAKAAAACAAALRASASGCDLAVTISSLAETLPECQAAFVGKVPVGGSCMMHALARPTLNARNSICREIPPGEEGERCVMSERPRFRLYPNSAASGEGVRCRAKDGFYCERVSSTLNRCAPVKADGAACADSYACGEGSYCDGTCKPLKAIGESCTSSLQCLGLGCDEYSSKCTDGMPQAACEGDSR